MIFPLLGCSNGRTVGPMFQKNSENVIDVISIFKPNVALANVVSDLGLLAVVGGPGNSMDRNYSY
jgi:hypothetical protein